MRRSIRPRLLLDWLMLRLARGLRPYLARAPLVWGDASRLSLGRNVHLVDAVVNLRSGTVSIGDHAFLGHGVMLLTGQHDYRSRGAARQTVVADSGNDIRIGHGVWIASGVIVLGPCEIGDDAVIGAGCVVTGVVPSGVIITGGAARKTREITFHDDRD